MLRVGLIGNSKLLFGVNLCANDCLSVLGENIASPKCLFLNILLYCIVFYFIFYLWLVAVNSTKLYISQISCDTLPRQLDCTVFLLQCLNLWPFGSRRLQKSTCLMIWHSLIFAWSVGRIGFVELESKKREREIVECCHGDSFHRAR